MFDFLKKKKPIDTTKYKLNLQKDKEDNRDLKLRSYFSNVKEEKLPKSVDLRPKFPSMFSQNDQGSCTANVGVAVLEYLLSEKRYQKLTLSRQYLYNKERINDGSPLTEDSGSSIRQICKTLKKNGCCKEMFFKYGWDNFAEEPTAIANDDAANYKIKSYMRCESLYEMKAALSLGLPILIGVEVYEDFYRATKAGIVPKIDRTKPFLGGHAITLVGYRPKPLSTKTQFLIRNSWGESIENLYSWGYAFNNPSDSGWGKDGYAWIDEDELEAILLDAWVITEI